MYKKTLLAAAAIGLASTAQAAAPSLEEMWELVQKQQAEIAQLKSQLSETEQRVAQTEEKTEATFAAVEEVSAGPVAKLAEWAEKTTIGGYGEVHYNNLTSDNSDNSKDEFDLHRFVLFFGHQFNDDLRFFSELEVEHNVAGEGKNGEVEIEQAYIEYDYAQHHRAKAGVFLMPVGIINETHEPDTFYGVERNNVEKDILPATWWEAGAMFSGELAQGLSYDAGVHSGLYINPMDGKYKIRDGRQKASEAKGDDLAYTGRLKYTGVPGLELAATVQYQSDLWQGETFGGEDEADATLWEAHAIYNSGPFGIRALYAHWDIDDAIEAVQAGADEQEGFYIEPSYRLSPKLGLFARYSEWDNQAGESGDTEKEQYDIGVNYWLAENVVLKADYMRQEVEVGDELRGFNLGVGWSF
ncbi:porin [Porticoccus litoralis]|uniref:Porin n=1 Tax=Porticoccus litoralis TaxID=434086 RepID=A0AAW8B0M0_9GAMM|nr:porin [Porticoccus litoralis]MDP1519577.1 porin [Porticoccus litoralis]